MGVFRQFPYSNFHEMNLDEMIKIVKNMLEEWAQYYAEWDTWMNQINDDWSNYQEVMTEAWQNMRDFINNYFDNLDVQNEINNKITSMVISGEFASIVAPYIPPTVTAWLSEHITEPVGVVIDTSLTVAGACADAKATGDEIRGLKNAVNLVTEYFPLQVVDNARHKISIADRTIVSGGTTQYVSRKIGVEEGQILKITGSAGEATTAEWAFAYNGTISYVYPVSTADTTQHYSTQIVVVPNGVNELYISRYSTLDVASSAELLISKNNEFVSKNLKLGDFEIGVINPTTGTPITDSTRIRTNDYIDENIDVIKSTNSNHGIALFAYDKTTSDYAGIVQSNLITILPTGQNVSYFVGTLDLRLIPNYENYKYKMVIRNDVADTITSAIETIKYYEELSATLDNINIDTEPEIFFASKDDVEKASTALGVISLYDTLVSDYPNYVTKNTLTYDSFTNYEYVFDSGNYNEQSGQRTQDAEVNKPVILITSGVHGNEPSAVMSAYTFFKALCDNVISVSRFRNDFIFKVIPVVCQWGYTNDKRWNENGVNINRNFDANWVLDGEPFTNSYSGESAASENETQIVQNWILANNAMLLIDFHNSGYTNEVSYLGIKSGESYSDNIRWSYRYGINSEIGHWQKDRNMNGSTLIYGYTGNMQIGGSEQLYGQQKGLVSCTFETSINQDTKGANSAETIGIGAEAFSAFIKGIDEHYLPTIN